MRKVAALFALLSFVSIAFSQGHRFSADELTKIVRMSDPQVSPDGRTISIVVGHANLKEDRWESEIDFVDVATKQLRIMTRERVGVGSVHWSPTGDRIAYLAQDGDKKAQIYLMPLNGGDSVQLTHSKSPVTVMAWQPDGQELAYAAADEDPERKDEAKFDDAFEVGNNSYLERAAARPVHLWTVKIGGQAKRLTSGSWSLPVHMAPSGPPPQIAYTADGRSILFLRAESPFTGDADTARLQIVDAATGATRALTKGAVAEGSPILSPDGTLVAYGSARDGKQGNEETIYVAPTAGGGGRDVASALDRGISSAAWMPDGKTLLISANDGTKVAYWLQPLNGPAKRVPIGNLCPSPGMGVGKEGAIALTATDATHPAELFYIAHVGDAPVQMTHLQTVTDGVTLGRQETVTWKSDKLDVDGVLTYPPDYAPGRKYPLVLYIHGGPTATSLETFTPASQILAAQGWLVLEPNYRGSNNQGNAFETAIVHDASAGPGRDIMAGVKALQERGIVDEKRIAVSGWSYGGQMTSWMIGNYPAMWKAAVAGAPVTDLVDQYSLSDNNVERVEHYGPSPFVGDNLKSYAVQSPITYAWKVKAPTLIMSDVGDWRVTTTQAYKLFHALKDNGVTVKFVAFPVPGHSPSDPLRSRDVWRRWTAWLARYLNEPTPTNPAK